MSLNPPLHAPIADKNGIIAPVWVGFFGQALPKKLDPSSVGTTLAATTLSGDYAQDAPSLQALFDKVAALEAALKNQTLVKD